MFVPCLKNNAGSVDEFFLATNLESSGSPPKRAPPPVPTTESLPILPNLSTSLSLDSTQDEELSGLSKTQSLNSSKLQELTVDDIEDFEDGDYLEEVISRRYSRRGLNDASDITVGLPSFATGKMGDNIHHSCTVSFSVATGKCCSASMLHAMVTLSQFHDLVYLI